MINDQLQAVLTEYETLRKEILGHTDLRQKITGLIATIVVGLYASGVQFRNPLPFLAIPPLGFVWMWVMKNSYEVHNTIASYIICEIEMKRIPRLVKSFNSDGKKAPWIFWSTHFTRTSLKSLYEVKIPGKTLSRYDLMRLIIVGNSLSAFLFPFLLSIPRESNIVWSMAAIFCILVWLSFFYPSLQRLKEREQELLQNSENAWNKWTEYIDD